EVVAQSTDIRRDDLRQRAAMCPEHRRSRKQRLDEREPERLVPERRHPETACAREQCALPVPVHGTDVANVPTKTWPPAARDQQALPGVLRRLDGPAISFRAVQAADEEIVILFLLLELEAGGVQAVVHKAGAAMPARMIPREEDGIW